MSLVLTVRNVCYPCYFDGFRSRFYLNVLMTPGMSNEEMVSQILSEGELYEECPGTVEELKVAAQELVDGAGDVIRSMLSGFECFQNSEEEEIEDFPYVYVEVEYEYVEGEPLRNFPITLL